MNAKVAWGFGFLVITLMVFSFGLQPLIAQTHSGDVTIDGSLGVGTEISASETFSDDTLRLKEDVIRLHFNDTSTSGFPGNDWRIIINDSSSGGANHFSIEDSTAGRRPFAIEAGSPFHSLYVNATGDVGFGTSNPLLDLSVKSSDTPGIRLEQDGVIWTPQTWDVAGNDSNFFIRDATYGSNLIFRIEPGSASDSIFIRTDNQVGFGTDTPSDGDNLAESFIDVVAPGGLASPGGDARVIVDSRGENSFSEFLMQEDNVNKWSFGRYQNRFYIFDYAGGDEERLTIRSANGNVGIGNNNPTFDLQIGTTPFSGVNAGDTAFTNTSSRTMKENLTPVASDGILDKISGVQVYTYDYIDGPKNKLGLIAEDFHQVFQRGGDTTINGQEVQMALWLAVQELEQRAHEQEQKNAEIAAMAEKNRQQQLEIKQMKLRLERLERLIK